MSERAYGRLLDKCEKLEADNARLFAEFKLVVATAPWSDKDGHAECLRIARRALGLEP